MISIKIIEIKLQQKANDNDKEVSNVIYSSFFKLYYLILSLIIYH